jgi:hypothetical protein
MKKQIELPEYLTIEAYQKLGDIEGLSEIDLVVRVLTAITGYDIDEIRTWDLSSIGEVYRGINKHLLNFENVIIPVFEFEGTLYGMQSLSKMTIGEYIDLERLLAEGNIQEVIAIMYRPITKNKLDSFERMVIMNLKAVAGLVDNIMKWYEIEEYYNIKRFERSEILKRLPMSVATGAYSFFLLTGLQSQISSLIYSEELTPEQKKEIQMTGNSLFNSITDGTFFCQN